MATAHRVKSIVAVLRSEDGKLHHLSRGADVSKYPTEEVERLTKIGLVEKYEPAVQTELQEKAGDGGDDGPPPKAANKYTWVEFAISKGASQEDAEKLTKDQLIEQYGS